MSLKPTLLFAAIAVSMASGAGATDLIEAYNLARQSDPQLAAAEANSLAIGQGVPITRANLLPLVNGNVGVTQSDNSGATNNELGEPEPFETDSRNRTWNVRLDQSIFDWGNYTALGSAKATRAQAQADYEAAVDGLLLRVSEAYFGVLTAEDALAFAEAEERAVGRQLDQAEQRFEVGLTAVTDVHEARARFDGARANVINARNALDDAREALAEITGVAHEDLLALRLNIPLDGPDPEALPEWEDVALQASPALASRRFALEAANKNIGTARSAHLPRLDGFISHGDTRLLSGDVGPFTTRSAEQTQYGLNLVVPIFAGFATQARVRQTVYQRDAAEDFLEAERRLLLRQTRNDFRATVAGISSVEARRQALLSAQSALEATQAGFEVGTRTIVDVLLSQQLLFQAQRDYSLARHQFILNGLRLKRTAGVIEVQDLQGVNALLTTERLSPEEIGARVAADAANDAPRAPSDASREADDAARDGND
jgi:outer membrane protein